MKKTYNCKSFFICFILFVGNKTIHPNTYIKLFKKHDFN